MLAEAVAEREEVVLAIVALALADRAVQPRVEALAPRAPWRRAASAALASSSSSRWRRAANAASVSSGGASSSDAMRSMTSLSFDAFDAWSPATRGRFGLCSPRSDARRRRAAASSFRSELSISILLYFSVL